MRKIILALACMAPSLAVAQPYGTSLLPFAQTSFWNIGMGSGQQWSNPTDADAQQYHQLQGVMLSDTYGSPTYFGTASDPVMTVTDSDNLFGIPPQSIHIPAGVTPAAGTDQGLALFDSTQPTKGWSYWGCSVGIGAISCGLGGVMDITGDGVDTFGAPSAYDGFAGVISDYDLSVGVIAHMLRYELSTNVSHCQGDWSTNIPWPNQHVDYNCATMYSGPIMAGQTIGIPAGIDLRTLGLSQGGMMLATALQNYGAIWRDSCGTNNICFQTSPANSGNPMIQQMQADLPKIIPQLEILRNQGPNSVNGGADSIITISVGAFTGTNPASVLSDPTATAQLTALSTQIDQQQQTIAAIQSVPMPTLPTSATQAMPPTTLMPSSNTQATPGVGTVLDADHNVFSVSNGGSVLQNGELVEGGGGTSAVTQVNGVIWGQDNRTNQWFIWDGNWWVAQNSIPGS